MTSFAMVLPARPVSGGRVLASPVVMNRLGVYQLFSINKIMAAGLGREKPLDFDS